MPRSRKPASGPTASCTPEDILAGHSQQVRALATRLRALVNKALPGVTERGYPGWRLIGYRREAYLCFIQPMKDHVRLGFELGIHLPDPDGLLDGPGKQVRYVRIDSENIPEAGICRLLKAAVHVAQVPREFLSKG